MGFDDFRHTGAWYSSFVLKDSNHARIVNWMRSNSLPLVTTDYVVDETLTLLRARGQTTRAIAFGRRVFDLDEDVRLVLINATDLRRAWQIFREQPERKWSFTDCTSRAVIERLHIKQALCLDAHFREFAGLDVVP